MNIYSVNSFQPNRRNSSNFGSLVVPLAEKGSEFALVAKAFPDVCTIAKDGDGVLIGVVRAAMGSKFEKAVNNVFFHSGAQLVDGRKASRLRSINSACSNSVSKLYSN